MLRPLVYARPSTVGLLALLTGGFVTMFDLFVVNLAIPAIREELDAGLAQMGYVIAAYQLSFGVLLIAGGRLGDRYGRRRVYRLGMLGFAATSTLCALAWSAEVLIVARLMQGATAALLLPQVYALIRVSYGEEQRRRVFGLLGMTLGVAAISGQIVGGLLVKADVLGLGWRLVFLVNLPIGLGVALCCRAIVESQLTRKVALDGIGTLIASVGLCLLLVALMEGPASAWAGDSLIALLAAVPVLVGFVVYERRLARRGGAPAIDFELFRGRVFGAGSLVVLLIYSTSSSFFLCMALLLQSGLGFDPLVAGLTFVPANLAFAVTSLAAPRLVRRFGNSTIGWGIVLYALAIGVLSGLVHARGATITPWELLPALCLFGAGQAMAMTPLINLVIGDVAESRAGMAAALVSTLQQFGGALGVAVVGMVFIGLLGAASSAEHYVRAFSAALLLNVGTALAAALLTFWLCGGPARGSRAQG